MRTALSIMAGRKENQVGNLTLQDQMDIHLLVIYAILYLLLLDLMVKDVQSHMKVQAAYEASVEKNKA